MTNNNKNIIVSGFGGQGVLFWERFYAMRQWLKTKIQLGFQATGLK